MSHLVLLGAQSGGLEKILSRMNTMLVKELDPALPAHPVKPGDSSKDFGDQD